MQSRQVFNPHRRKARLAGASANAGRATVLLLSALVFVFSGCSVHEKKNGSAENVHLHTPLGGFDVRTNAVHGADIGLPVYPGAVETGQHGDDSGSADIHMSFGQWHLHVKAIGYRSSDPEEKVIAFYKNAMAQYGDVLTCKHRTAIGEPAKTSQGLTCDNGHEYEVTMSIDKSKKHMSVSTPQISGAVKLLAGSPESQHIVEFNPTVNGTKFSMIVVQLPHRGQTD